jgi:hypothetical protein
MFTGNSIWVEFSKEDKGVSLYSNKSKKKCIERLKYGEWEFKVEEKWMTKTTNNYAIMVRRTDGKKMKRNDIIIMLFEYGTSYQEAINVRDTLFLNIDNWFNNRNYDGSLIGLLHF